ncbi:MAG TPA: acyltransferase domain-containing protein, partial [Gammaproteobacteria bacterium]|nr:acyltransferase domain-containing protein [Gammaproteobacteria bacterium]
LLLSAKTKPALEKITTNLTQKLQTINTPNLADIAFTLQVGRADFNYRRMLVSKNADEALLQLKNLPPDSVFNRHHTTVPKLVFMFSGQGTQYIGMGQALYGLEPIFTEWVDYCCDLLEQDLKHAVHSLIFQSLKNDEETHDTAVIQPALFIVEYSLAKLLMSLGIKPDAMIGHSVGEYVAACLAEVMSLENALRLICYRGRLMATSSPGMMLAVHMAENELLEFLGSEKISIATINSSTSCVISGELKTIYDVEEKLKKIGIVSHRLKTSHAFHSHMMDPILDDFRRILETVDLQAPNIRFISNVTGNWINAEEATSPDYWTHHLRHTVKFSAGLKTLVNDGTNIFIEVGPGKTLCRFVQELVKKDFGICVTNTLPTSNEEVSFGQKSLLLALGQLWLHGVKINWANYDKRTERKKLVLPTYPFERRVYWLDPDNKESNQNIYKKQPYPKWLYEPSWIRASLSNSKPLSENILINPSCWLLLLDNEGSGDNIARILLQNQQTVITVKQGSDFVVLNNQEYMINITKKEDYQKLVMMLCKITSLPLKVINLFALTSEHSIDNLDLSEVQKTLYLCFYSSLFLAQALIEQQYEQQINILAVGNEIYSVTGSEKVYPAKNTVAGPCRVIPQEHPNFKMRVLDVVLSEIQDKHRDFICQQIISTLLEEHDSTENIVAYRGQFRWTQVFQPLKCKLESCFTLRPEGVYLLTGGLGGISLTIAKLIAQSSKNPKLILISRSQFPKQADWKIWLAEHG